VYGKAFFLNNKKTKSHHQPSSVSSEARVSSLSLVYLPPGGSSLSSSEATSISAIREAPGMSPRTRAPLNPCQQYVPLELRDPGSHYNQTTRYEHVRPNSTTSEAKTIEVDYKWANM